MIHVKYKILKSITSIMVVMLLFSCENSIDKINSLTNKTPHSDAKNITIIKTDSAKIVGIIFASIGASLFIPLYEAIIAATIAMLLEATEIKMNNKILSDNILIPLAAGTTVLLLRIYF